MSIELLDPTARDEIKELRKKYSNSEISIEIFRQQSNDIIEKCPLKLSKIDIQRELSVLEFEYLEAYKAQKDSRKKIEMIKTHDQKELIFYLYEKEFYERCKNFCKNSIERFYVKTKINKGEILECPLTLQKKEINFQRGRDSLIKDLKNYLNFKKDLIDHLSNDDKENENINIRKRKREE